MNAPVKSTPNFGANTRTFISAGIPARALLPIAPVDARISNVGHLCEDVLGKAPGRFNARQGTWTGLGGRYVQDGVPKSEIAAMAAWPTPNVGILGRFAPGIDSDAENDDARRLVERVVLDVFGREAGIAERVRGDSPRRLYAFRSRDPAADTVARTRHVSYRLKGEDERHKLHKIDVIGAGNQYLIAGTHPSGAEYDWLPDYRLDDLFRDGALERVDDADIVRFLDAFREELEASGGVIVSSRGGGAPGEEHDYSDAEPLFPVKDIFDGLDRIPNNADNFETRDDFVSILSAIRAALGSEAEQEREAVEAWACEDPEWCSAEYFDKVWESLDRGVRVPRDALDRVFRRSGVFASARAEFPPLTQEEQEDIAKAEAIVARARDELLDEVAKTYVFSRVNLVTDDRAPEIRRRDEPAISKSAIAWWQMRSDDLNESLIQKLRTCGRYTPDEIGFWSFHRDLYRNRPEMFYVGQTRNPNYERGEIVSEQNPDETFTRKLNMRWQSPVIRYAQNSPADPVQAADDVEFLLAFIRKLIGPDAEYELDTLAYMVQTGRRPGNMLFMEGEPGVGKSTYIQILVSMFDGSGKDVGGQIDGTKLVAEGSRRFALAKIEGCRIISIKELPENTSPAAMAQIISILKQYVGAGSDADYVQIERKGKDQETIENFGRIVVTTNYASALRIEQNDRRTFYVRCNITLADRPPANFYRRLNDILGDPRRLATLYRYLRDHRDIRNYDPAAAPPLSDAKLEAQICDMSNPVERHVAAAVALVKASGREMVDLAEMAVLAGKMAEAEYRNTNGAVDDRGTPNFRAPGGPEQAALRYLTGLARKLGPFKTDRGNTRVSAIYVFTGTAAERLTVSAGARGVMEALERDRSRHPLTPRHPLKRFAGPLQAGEDRDG